MLKETIETITINLKRAQNDFNEIKSWDNISPDYYMKMRGRIFCMFRIFK